MGKTVVTAILSFTGKHRWLSNFYPVSILFEGTVYPSVEHAYVAAKTEVVALRALVPTMTAGEAKRFGRRLILRANWDDLKLGIMEQLLRTKFEDAALRAQLKATGIAPLVEGNTWRDRYWGTYMGQGENHLGKLLMKIRAGL